MKQPFYLFKKEQLVENYRTIQDIFCKDYEDFILAYSFKTNPHPFVLETLKDLDSTIEVVSPYEYETARRFGFPPEKIIYNGVCKDEETFMECALNGGKINIDNEEDLKIALEYFEKSGKPLKIGVRMNFDIGNGIKSRFGISAESKLFEKILQLEKDGKIIVNGLHCHFTKGRELVTWRNRAKGMLKIAEFFRNLEYVDFGGNMKPMSEENLMTQYSEILSDAVCQICESNNRKIKLIIEAGTPVAAEAFDLTAQVIHVKDGYIFLNIRKYDLGEALSGDKCKLLVNNLGSCAKSVTNYKIVGATCMENDILKKSFSGKIEIGDEVVFKNVGAYSICLGNEFILGRVKVYLQQ